MAQESTLRSRRHTVIAVLTVALLLVPRAHAWAQDTLAAVPNADFTAAWSDVHPRFAPAIAAAPAGAAKQALYGEMFDKLFAHPKIAQIRNSPKYQAELRELLEQLPESKLAVSAGAPLTNAQSNQLVERSGFTNLVAFAADLKELFSADKSAITINLNAVALLGGGKGGDRAAQYVYAKREQWRRLGGSVTFGAKIPEKELTGVTGVPSAETLFDAVAWDLKLRIIGDRDPRARRWYPLLIDEVGRVAELAARMIAMDSTPPGDANDLEAALTRRLGDRVAEAKRRISSSLQVSVKGDGRHLTTEDGKNRYGFVVLADKGVGGIDLTGNVAYHVADGAVSDTTASPFKTRTWLVSGGLTGSFAKNRLFPQRAIELTGSAAAQLPMDAAAVPIERKRIFKANATVTLPFQQKGRIPISVTFSNDPNNLTKEKYVTGQIGVSYDFGAVWDLFK